MNKSFEREPPKGLLEKILKRIRREERFLVFRRTAIFSVMLIASLLGVVPSLKIVLTDFGQSGFINFFSLLFSDFHSVATYWQSFLMILLETLPAASLALFLFILLILLQSFKSLVKNIKIIKSHHLVAY